MRTPSPGGDHAVQHLFHADSRTRVVNPPDGPAGQAEKAVAQNIRSLFSLLFAFFMFFIQRYGDS
jgi:hypothetical protein